MMWIAYAAAWLSTGAAVSFGVYYTHSANCLWALVIPALLSVTNRRGDATNGNPDIDVGDDEADNDG